MTWYVMLARCTTAAPMHESGALSVDDQAGRRVLLEIDAKLRDTRQPLARAAELDVVDELHVDLHVVAQVLAERRQDLLEHVVRVAPALDHLEAEGIRTILDHLEALDR